MVDDIGWRGAILAALLMVILSLTIGGATQAVAASYSSPWGESYFPNLPVITQDGQAVRFYEDLLKNKLVVINTISTRCAACLPDAQRLAQAQQLLGDRVGKDVFFYSITSDPEQDTAPVLKEYAEKLHAGPGWLFLTGQRTDLDLLGKKLGFAGVRKSGDPIARSATLAIGNEAAGRWWWRTPADDPQFLALMIDMFLPGGPPRQPGKSYAETAPLSVRGHFVFATRCGICHTIGHGDVDAPDLQGVTARRERAWLARWLANPDQMLTDGDPTAKALYSKYNSEMPNLHLGERDVDALLTYLESQSIAQ